MRDPENDRDHKILELCEAMLERADEASAAFEDAVRSAPNWSKWEPVSRHEPQSNFARTLHAKVAANQNRSWMRRVSGALFRRKAPVAPPPKEQL